MPQREGYLMKSIALGLLLAIVVHAAPAQASRWVSPSGNDMNNCSDTSPCRLFQRAHDVAINGETIVCLSNGSFGTVVISRSIAIDCTGTGGTIDICCSPAVGITVDGAGIIVTLRGLVINSNGDGNMG